MTTWLFSIVLNRARTRATRAARLVGLPELDGGEPDERAVPLSAFQPDGHWVEAPRLWDDVGPERLVGERQLWVHVQAAIERLPSGQRAVLVLRELEGCTAEDACSLLGITAENRRMLLHRPRGRIRTIVDALVGDAPEPTAQPIIRTRPGPRASPLRRRIERALCGLSAFVRECLWTAGMA